MNRDDLKALLDSLPDEWIDSAAEPELPHRRMKFRFWVSAAAACAAVLLAAAVYPHLRTQAPERIETTASTVQTTVLTTTTQTETHRLDTGTTSAAYSAETAHTFLTQTEAASITTISTQTQTESVRTSAETTVYTAPVTTETTVSPPVTVITASSAVTYTTTAPVDVTEPAPVTLPTQTTTSVSTFQPEQPVMTTPAATMQEVTDIKPANTQAEASVINSTAISLQCWKSPYIYPENTAPAETTAFPLNIHATVYTEALPDKLEAEFPEKPVIDMEAFDAVLLRTDIVFADAVIYEASITNGKLILSYLAAPTERQHEPYPLYYLLAIPKEFHIQAEKVSVWIQEANSQETYQAIYEQPLTLFYYYNGN